MFVAVWAAIAVSRSLLIDEIYNFVDWRWCDFITHFRSAQCEIFSHIKRHQSPEKVSFSFNISVWNTNVVISARSTMIQCIATSSKWTPFQCFGEHFLFETKQKIALFLSILVRYEVRQQNNGRLLITLELFTYNFHGFHFAKQK